MSWIRALGDIGDQRAVPTLMALTEDDHPSIRLWAVLAMRRIGDPRCVSALERSQGDADQKVAEAATGAIEAMRNSQAPNRAR